MGPGNVTLPFGRVDFRRRVGADHVLLLPDALKLGDVDALHEFETGHRPAQRRAHCVVDAGKAAHAVDRCAEQQYKQEGKGQRQFQFDRELHDCTLSFNRSQPQRGPLAKQILR